MNNDIGKIYCNVFRRFGVEIELNSFDGRNRPVDYEFGVLPEGSHHIANLVHKSVRDKVFLQKWQNNHNNDCWILKPDSSCGIEVCTPVLKGMDGLRSVCSVVDAFARDVLVMSDQRCSFHVHVDVHDLNVGDIAALVSWWVKMEHFFMRIVPMCRRRNRYCQMLSFSSIFEKGVGHMMSDAHLVASVGRHKYYSFNAYHMQKKKRKTVEFRIMDSSCCLSYHDAKNYLLLLLHFVELAVEKGSPREYDRDDPLTGYSWLGVAESLGFLRMEEKSSLSEGMSEVRRWLYGRLLRNEHNGESGIFGYRCKSLSEEHLRLFSLFCDDYGNFKFSEDKFLE